MKTVEREQRSLAIADAIRVCQRCTKMNVPGKTQAAPGFGCVVSPVVIVGQSLCGPCMEKQEPFFGGCGEILDKAFERAGVEKKSLFTTNVVHCHPPRNRKSKPEEIENCLPYLWAELEIVEPRLIIGLGQDARTVLSEHHPQTHPLVWPFDGSVISGTSNCPDLLFPPHPGSLRWKPIVIREELTEQYVSSLARAVAAGFGRA